MCGIMASWTRQGLHIGTEHRRPTYHHSREECRGFWSGLRGAGCAGEVATPQPLTLACLRALQPAWRGQHVTLSLTTVSVHQCRIVADVDRRTQRASLLPSAVPCAARERPQWGLSGDRHALRDRPTSLWQSRQERCALL